MSQILKAEIKRLVGRLVKIILAQAGSGQKIGPLHEVDMVRYYFNCTIVETAAHFYGTFDAQLARYFPGVKRARHGSPSQAGRVVTTTLAGRNARGNSAGCPRSPSKAWLRA